jgi:hypothetical protein
VPEALSRTGRLGKTEAGEGPERVLGEVRDRIVRSVNALLSAV